MNNDDVRLYRDDGLGKVFKSIVKRFKKFKLSFLIDGNLKTVDLLDVTFDPNKNPYKPYRNSNPISINKNSNHLQIF